MLFSVTVIFILFSLKHFRDECIICASQNQIDLMVSGYVTLDTLWCFSIVSVCAVLSVKSAFILV